jgi:hypothetical protein
MVTTNTGPKYRKDRNQPMHPLYTRDGNPRKRLARACDRCRVQKIRCRLEGRKCVQCEKQKFACQFSTRKHRPPIVEHARDRSSQEALSNDSPAPSAPSHRRWNVEETHLAGLAPRSLSDLEARSPYVETDGVSHSRAKQFSDGGPKSAASTPLSMSSILQPVATKTMIADLSIDMGPYWIDINLITHYIGQYFRHFECPPYRLLPPHTFLRWAENETEKNAADLLVLYAILAAGALLSRRTEHDLHHQVFSKIIQTQLDREQDSCNLQTVLARLILASVNLYLGDPEQTHRLDVAALGEIRRLRYNNEKTTTEDICGFLSNVQIAECRRRTFWLACIRINLRASQPDTKGELSDLFADVRLPCDDTSYDNGTVVSGPCVRMSRSQGSPIPYFEKEVPTSITALMAEASTLLATVTTFARQATRTHERDYAASYTAFARETETNVHGLRKRIREYSQVVNAPLPLDLALITDFILLSLRRHVRHTHLSTPQIAQCLSDTRQHARHLLRRLPSTANPNTADPDHPTITPLSSTAITLAFDTLTSSGLLSSITARHTSSSRTSTTTQSTLTALATNAITTLSESAHSSPVAQTQLRNMETRLGTMLALSNTAVAARKRAFFFAEPLASTELVPGFGPNADVDGDVCYGLRGGRLLNALGLQTGTGTGLGKGTSVADDEILEMRLVDSLA